tara:strand:+ start:205 stop:702 length:498 start_codon:yes stop_codon:yes gene_type:complete
MEFLFVSPTTLKSKTIIGGNVDNDKIVYIISDVQNTTILPLLGQELYDVISAGAEDDTLTGLHLELYTNFVQPITKFQTVANYVMISNYMIDNGGSVIHNSETSTPMTMDELNVLSSTYAGMADTYVNRFEDWITINYVEEYKTAQDGVDAIKGINNRSGWFFGS